MSLKFFGGQNVVWQALRKAFGKGRKAQVAVAFLGQGSFSRMRLAAGSTLVVNASLETVRSGQTDPGELLKYLRARVRVFTYANLHAKVYVIGRSCFVGSANVSSTSENRLVESTIVCSDAVVVRKSREFVLDHAVDRLGPEALKQLKAQYRPPKLLVNGARKPRGTSQKTEGPLIAHTAESKWTPSANEAERVGLPVAKRRLKNSRDFRIETCECDDIQALRQLKVGRYVYQVAQAGRIKRLHPGGRIVHVEPFKDARRKAAIVYMELPRNRRSRLLSSLPSEMKETTKMLRSLNSIREIRNQKHAALLARLFD